MAAKKASDKQMAKEGVFAGTANVITSVPGATGVNPTVVSLAGRKGLLLKDIEDAEQADKELVVAAAEQIVVSDSVVATSDQPMQMAMADTTATAGSSEPVKVEHVEAAGSSNPGGWWLGGAWLAAAVGGVGVALSNNNDDASPGSSSNTVVMKGTVTDGPVAGAALYADINKDGKWDAGDKALTHNGVQIVTDATGNFQLTEADLAENNVSLATLKLLSHGGTDTVSGEAVTIDFSAPVGYSYINPVTSIIAAYMELNPTLTAAAAETAVVTALGLPDLDYAQTNLADLTDLAPAEALAVQQVAAILATAAIVLEQAGDPDSLQYLAENLGSGTDTAALVTAVIGHEYVTETAVTQLEDTVTAVEAATDLDSINTALNETFFVDLAVTHADTNADQKLDVGETLTAQLGLGNTTDANIAYQWQASADGTDWADVSGATGASYLLTSADSGDHIRVAATYTNPAGEEETIHSADKGVVTNHVPEFASVATADVAENSAAVLTVAATDADNHAIAYSITGGADQAKFAIDATTGALTFIDAPDFENATDADGDNSYVVEVSANDGYGGVTAQVITASVTGVNEAPVITSGTTGTVVENAATSTVVYTATATDVDTSSTLTYSLAGTDAAAFAINGATGAVTLLASADFETKASYSIDVVATDNGTGALSDSQAVTISITGVNEAPVITSGITGTVAENAEISTVVYTATATDVDASSTLTYSLSGTDAAAFAIDGATGAVTLRASADFETKASYSIDVVATDNGTGALSDSQAVTISVTGVNEAPVLASADTATVAENADTSTVVYTATATDVDADDTRAYSLTGDDAEFFTISSSGVVTLKESANYEAKSSYGINVIATDAAGLTATQAVSIAVTNLDEVAPTFNSVATATAIAEKSGAAQVVYTAASTDTGDIATGSTVYSLKAGTADAASFSIDGSTGAVTLTGDPDYETKSSYDFTVVATDAAGHASEQAVVLNVTNVNDNDPLFTSAIAADVAENSSAVFTVVATDADGDTVAYSITGGEDSTKFAINETTGALTFVAAPDFENPTDVGADQTYHVQVSATDGLGGVTVQNIAATVTDATEVSVVVENGGAYIDVNSDGVIDYSDYTTHYYDYCCGSYSCLAPLDADFGADGNADLAANQVTIHFNDVPGAPLDLTHFGADDKIELDVASIAADQVHYAYFQAGLTEGAVHYPAAASAQWEATFSGVTGGLKSAVNHPMFGLDSAGVLHAGHVSTGSGTGPMPLMTSPTAPPPVISTQLVLANNLTLDDPAHQISLVNFVTPVTHEVHVVVDPWGAFIDRNSDGVLDSNDYFCCCYAQANFGTGGNADLAANQVTIHFNDIPRAPLDLSNFDVNDKIEIDIAQFQHNVFVTTYGFGMFADIEQMGTKQLAHLTDWDRHFGADLATPFHGVGADGQFIAPVVLPGHDLSGAMAALNVAGMGLPYGVMHFDTTVNGGAHSHSRALTGFVGGPTTGGMGALGAFYITSSGDRHLNPLAFGLNAEAASLHQISLVNAPLVYGVDAAGAWLDRDEDGIRDGGLEVSVGDDGIDASRNTVVFHVYDTPDAAIDVTGFGLDDRVLIDAQSLANQHAANDADKFLQIGLATGWMATHQLVGMTNSYVGFNHNSSNLFSVDNVSNDNSRKLIVTSESNDTAYRTHALLNLISATSDISVGSNNLHTVVDFINPVRPPAADIHVIVDGRGVYIDANGDGIVNNSDISTPALFGDHQNADLAYNHVTVHFNDAPASTIDLSGFGTDDKIEFDVAAMVANGNPGMDAFAHTGTHSFQWHVGTGTPTANTGSGVGMVTDVWNASGLSVHENAQLTVYGAASHKLHYVTAYRVGEAASNVQAGTLATFDSQVPLSQVHFVDLPIHIVVNSDGSYFDDNNNNWFDDGEIAATFGTSGNVDFANNQVTVHFNDLPASGAIDLTGFDANDKIEVDITAMIDNGHLGMEAFAQAGADVSASSTYVYKSFSNGYYTTATTGNLTAVKTVYEKAMFDLASSSLNYQSRHQTANDAVDTYAGALATFDIDSQITMEQVEFVNAPLQTFHVVVDSNGAYVDGNENGIVDEFDSCHGVTFGGFNDDVDLAHNTVTVHFNGIPEPENPLDFTGFGADDRVEIDLTAISGSGHGTANIAANALHFATLSNSMPGVHVHTNALGQTGAAVYTNSVSGGNLFLGHVITTTTGTTTPNATGTGSHWIITDTRFSYRCNATSEEGHIAINAGTLSLNQVDFVAHPIIP